MSRQIHLESAVILRTLVVSFETQIYNVKEAATNKTLFSSSLSLVRAGNCCSLVYQRSIDKYSVFYSTLTFSVVTHDIDHERTIKRFLETEEGKKKTPFI